MLKDMLTEGYPSLFDGFDLSTATGAQLQEKFNETGAQGETLNKCLSFFSRMAKDAALPLSPFVRTRRQHRTTNGRKLTPKVKQRVSRATVEREPDSEVAITPFKVLYDLLDPSEMDDAEQQAVWTLLRYLKRKGE